MKAATLDRAKEKVRGGRFARTSRSGEAVHPSDRSALLGVTKHLHDLHQRSALSVPMAAPRVIVFEATFEDPTTPSFRSPTLVGDAQIGRTAQAVTGLIHGDVHDEEDLDGGLVDVGVPMRVLAEVEVEFRLDDLPRLSPSPAIDPLAAEDDDDPEEAAGEDRG